MIEGALILLVGLAVGRLSAGRRKTSPSQTFALSGATICGCTHHLSMHDPKAGDCHGAMKNPAYSKDQYVSKSNPKEIKCSCRHFVATDNSAEIVSSWTPPKEIA